jgi:hypothetical protein
MSMLVAQWELKLLGRLEPAAAIYGVDGTVVFVHVDGRVSRVGIGGSWGTTSTTRGGVG